MSFWSSLASFFTKNAGVPTPPVEAQMPHSMSQTTLSSTPSQVADAGSYLDPSGGMIAQQSSGFLGSLWDGLKTATALASQTVKGVWGEVKEVAPTAVQLYKEVKSAGAASLSLVMPNATPPSPNYQLSTPYQRDSSGATPAVISTGGGGGISMPLILGIAALAVFLFMKGKKK